MNDNYNADDLAALEQAKAAMAAASGMQNVQAQRQRGEEVASQSVPDPTTTIKNDSSTATANKSLAERIREMEEKSGVAQKHRTVSTVAVDSYRDELGNETFYIKNVSGGKLVLGDMSYVLSKGAVDDLLQVMEMEDIKKSSDLRKQLNSRNAGLVRLTPEQYLKELEEMYTRDRRIQAIRSEKVQDTRASNKVRPLIDSQLEKLNLYFDPNPELQRKGLEPEAFIKWLMLENFNENELDYMLGYPKIMSNADIRAAIIQKKKINM